MDASKPPVPALASCVMASWKAVRSHSAVFWVPGTLLPNSQVLKAANCWWILWHRKVYCLPSAKPLLLNPPCMYRRSSTSSHFEGQTSCEAALNWTSAKARVAEPFMMGRIERMCWYATKQMAWCLSPSYTTFTFIVKTHYPSRTCFTYGAELENTRTQLSISVKPMHKSSLESPSGIPRD